MIIGFVCLQCKVVASAIVLPSLARARARVCECSTNVRLGQRAVTGHRYINAAASGDKCGPPVDPRLLVFSSPRQLFLTEETH